MKEEEAFSLFNSQVPTLLSSELFFFVINFLSHISEICFFPTESDVYLFDLQITQNCLFFSILVIGLLSTGSLINLVSFLRTFVQI